MPVHGQDILPEQIEFFEARIRPVLIEHCYECHNSGDTAEGDLAVDSGPGFLKGGESGPIIVPGKPGQSRLLSILRHEVDGLEMPEGGPKLDARVVADFEQWILMGAPDPRKHAPSADELAAATSWEATLERRKQWWSFQPVKKPPVPASIDGGSEQAIDRFIHDRLHQAKLIPGPPADAAVLVRRLYFNLIGLPPNPNELTAWSARIRESDGSQRSQQVNDLIDELMDSPRFGERWARHWMDWIRYAESHGSEGDPRNKNAWYYRDYLIRALNGDVPYDQLVREHIAGDLLESPRTNAELGINESAIGTAHWRMVFHGFAPTDALDEKVRFTDDQINAFSKAFLGITVSCARCHDHKFDAISQADYYAMFGILGSCRPGRTVIDLPNRINANRKELAALKLKLRKALSDDWLSAAEKLAATVSDNKRILAAADKPKSVLHPLFSIQKEVDSGVGFETALQRWIDGYKKKFAAAKEQQTAPAIRRWDLSDNTDYEKWFAVGSGLPDRPHVAGEFSVAANGDRALTGVYPSGVYSHGISAKHAARLTSESFSIGEDSELWVRVLGDAGASVRYVVQNYPRNGTVYPVTKPGAEWKWQKFDLGYWKGDDVHIELTTAADAPLLTGNESRSWFGIQEAVLVKKGQKPPIEFEECLRPLVATVSQKMPTSMDELTQAVAATVRDAVAAWRDDVASDEQAVLLDLCLRQNLLPNNLDKLSAARPLVESYRKLEEAIPVPTRVPGLDETIGQDQPLFERGNHKQPAEIVPRRFLEAIDATPYKSKLSGRMELAEDILRDDNPLTRRVIVNRVWHHLFGRGLVGTPDNFGKLGEKVTHPELLDWLATRFSNDQWSLKKLIRLIVQSETWQQSATVSVDARERDPENRLLSHANVRRLEAEVIRDTLLSVSGRIQHQVAGPPVDGNAPRRSVYVRVIRNSLDPFLRTFDFPEPFSSVGRRDVTNVPAQSLAMMNDRQVIGYAESWARAVLGNRNLESTDQRLNQMFVTAFGRVATSEEISRAEDYLAGSRRVLVNRQQQRSQLRQLIEQRQHEILELTGPVREKLLAATRAQQDGVAANLPDPVGHWEFDGHAIDAVTEADVELRQGAHVADGALIVTKGGYAVTPPLKETIRAKTLQAWVQLGDLNQRSGGVMTIQTPNGVYFDSIVFAEKDPQQWLAGSNGFSRTQSFTAPQEREAHERPVHIAITYAEDGQITGYRDGVRYGQSYKSNGPYEYKAGGAIVSFGVRHLPAGGNRMLSGKVLKAQLFNRALSDAEIAAFADASPTFVSDGKVLAELSASQRETVKRLRREVVNLQAEVDELGAIPQTIDDAAIWADLARAMFTFKEFIYVR